MPVISLELVAILTTAFLIRAFNRFPPFYERLLVGLRFFDGIVPDVVARFIQDNHEKLNDVTSIGTSPSTHDVALQLLDTRIAEIAYSHFPYVRYPWQTILYKEALSLLLTTSAYGVVGYLAASCVEMLTSGSYSANVDVMLLAVLVAVFATPVYHLAQLGFRHSEVVFTCVTFIFGFLGSFVAIHTQQRERFVLTEFPIHRVLADLSSDNQILFGSSEIPDHPQYFTASILLSLVLGAAVALLYAPASRLARSYLSAAKSRKTRLLSWSQRALSHGVVLTPLFMFAVLSPSLLGDLAVVSTSFTPCTPTSVLRDCQAGEPASLSLQYVQEFPFVELHTSHSTWLSIRLLCVMAASVFMMLNTRTLLQGWLAEARNTAATTLTDLVATAVKIHSAEGNKRYTYGTLTDAFPVNPAVVEPAARTINISMLRRAIEAGLVASQLLLFPVVSFLAAALTAHRGHVALHVQETLRWIGGIAGVKVFGGLARAEVASASSASINDAIAQVFGENAFQQPFFRLLDASYALPLSLFSLSYIVCAFSAMVVLSVLFFELVYPVLLSSTGKVETPATPAATTPQTAATGSANKQGSKKHR